MENRHMITFGFGDATFTYRVAGVILRDGPNGREVLLETASGANFGVLPGGRCELGEQAMVGLKRELFEELGEEVTVERLLFTVENLFTVSGRLGHEIGLYFLVSLPESSLIKEATSPIPSSEGDPNLTYVWVRPGHPDDLPILPIFLRTALLEPLSATPVHIVNDERTG